MVATIWTNVEDEILKAAISKYSTSQWARISSLLARKSPKQCKARWEEFLNPSIRKTEWTKDEDEQLLHLVKIFGSQYRTIASATQGRSANQCLLRYQQLLDEAEKRENNELGLAGVGDAEAPTADDVRKLRVGEIDPNPENQPARPDAVDMDEEEKEMLSEARARMANTKGKKAARKERERLLETSRRVGQLQKRRELKMSGINIKLRTTKKGQMDYNADVPFEHTVPRGFYDVEEELERNEREKAAFDPKKQQLANKRKGDDEDDSEDRKRKKMDKGPAQSISAQAMKAAQQQKIREAERSSRRRTLDLPTPQVNEGELEEVVKMGMAGERANRSAITGDNNATRGLIGSYNGITSATPIRTPRAAPEEDRIANEMRNIKAITQTQSAILGGETTDLIEGEGSTGFAGVEPSKRQLVTPNPMATPFRQANGVGATPIPGHGATPMRTPRDTFNLNQQNGMVSVGQTPREVRQHEQGMRQNLLAKLAALPKPKAIDYELETPEEQEVMEITRANMGEDASIKDARERLLRDAAELAEFKRQTQVMQRRLPRPAVIDIDAMMKNAEAVSDPIQKEVAIETALLIANDAAKFGGSRVSGATRPVQVFDDELMSKARQAVVLEMASENAQKEKSAFTSQWSELHATTNLPGLDGYYEDEVDEHQMMVESFDNIEDKITTYAEKGNELEKRLAKLHGGYQNRAKMLREKITEAAEALEKTTIGLNVSLNAQVAEDAAIPRRLESLRDEVNFVSRREREAQEGYRMFKDELDGLPATNGYH